MKFEMENLPKFGTEARPATAITEEALKNSGVAMMSFGLEKGDEIEFPEDADGAIFMEQPIRANSTAKQVVVSVLRNGKPNWLALGTLTRRTAENKAVCPFTEKMISKEFENNLDRMKYLYGKKIKCVDRIEAQAQAFTATGERIQGQTETRLFPIIEEIA